MKTTEMLPAEEYQHVDTPCHGGEGPWIFKNYTKTLNPVGIIRFIHDDIIPPGSSFGVHKHEESDAMMVEEWYLCISGNGTMILDGEEFPFAAGQLNVCRNGGSHGIKNTGTTDMRILVICATAPVVK